MTNAAYAFIVNIPSTEEEMIAICNAAVDGDRSVENFNRKIEHLQELIGVMEDFRDRQKNRKRS